MEVDYSETCDKKLPEAEQVAASGRLDEALELLAGLEKQTRSGADTHSTGRVLVTIVQLCFNAKDWQQLNERIIDLVKKRSQLKQAVAKMIAKCCTFLDKTPDKPTLLALIDTLRTVTEGKIYVENERARLTHRLAGIHEKDGNIAEAAKIMQELQVETYGSMERQEKVELILEQMRLCLATQDYIRTQIISKKISTRFFEGGKHADLKLKIYDTAKIQEDPVEKIQTMKNVIMYVCLSKYSSEQSDLIHRVKQEKGLDEIPLYKAVLNSLTSSTE